MSLHHQRKGFAGLIVDRIIQPTATRAAVGCLPMDKLHMAACELPELWVELLDSLLRTCPFVHGIQGWRRIGILPQFEPNFLGAGLGAGFVLDSLPTTIDLLEPQQDAFFPRCCGGHVADFNHVILDPTNGTTVIWLRALRGWDRNELPGFDVYFGDGLAEEPDGICFRHRQECRSDHDRLAVGRPQYLSRSILGRVPEGACRSLPC